ncbi:hypothetical protein LBMAG53_33270 [Planctomycetota bacterium]|nr:hypothetical protein LBMAG53_33270 [Planctomycetota bacterium]
MPETLVVAIRALTSDWTGSELSAVVAAPRRTADRWLAAIRAGDCDDLPPSALARLIRHEAATWGTSRIVEALRANELEPVSKADAGSLIKTMTALAASHRNANQLLATMADNLSDGVLSDSEARSLLPLVEDAQRSAMEKCRALDRLSRAIHLRLGRG